MADDQGKNPAVPEKMKGGQEKQPDLSKEEQDLDRLAMRVQIEYKKPTRLETLNHFEKPLRQKEALVGLGLRCKKLIVKLINKEIITPENAPEFFDFSKFMEIDFSEAELDNNDQQTVLDLMLFKPGSSLNAFWLKTWPSLYAEAQKLHEELDEGVKEEGSWTNKMRRFYKKHRFACNVAGIGLLVGGLYLLFRKKDKTEEELSSSVASSWAIKGGIIAALGAAAYFGWDHVKNWFKSIGKNIEGLFGGKEIVDDIKKKVDDLKNKADEIMAGGEDTALDFITDDKSQPTATHEELAKAFSKQYGRAEKTVEGKIEKPEEFVNPRAMGLFRDIKYKDFRENYSEDRIYNMFVSTKKLIEKPGMEEAAKAWLTFNIANLNRTFATWENWDEEGAIDPETFQNKTVDEALTYIYEQMKQGKGPKEVQDDTIDIARKATKETVDSYSGFFKSFLSDAEWMSDTLGNGAIRQTVEGWKSRIDRGEFTVGDTWNMPADIMRACWENGIPMAIGAGTMAVWNGAKWLVFAHAVPVARAAAEIVSHGFIGGYKEAFKAYGIASSPLVVLGMAKGAFSGGPGGLLRRVVAGGVSGFTAPVRAVPIAYDAAYYSTHAREYISNIKHRATSLVKIKTKGRVVHVLQEGPLLRRLADPKKMAKIRQSLIIDRIIALEGRQHLIDMQLETKLHTGRTAEKWRATRNNLRSKINALMEEYGIVGERAGLESGRITGREISGKIDALIQKAKIEYLKKMYPKVPEGAMEIIQKNKKLADIFLTEGRGNVIVRKVLRMKHPEALLNMLNSSEEALGNVIRNRGLLRSRGFRRLAKMTERLAAGNDILWAKALKDRELAKLLTDPDIINNREFLINLEKKLQDGSFLKKAEKAGEKKVLIDTELLKMEARSARTPSLYKRFKANVAKNLKKAARSTKKTVGKGVRAVTEPIGRTGVGQKIEQAARRARVDMALRRMQMADAYKAAGEKLKLTSRQTKEAGRVVKAWTSKTPAQRQLEKLVARRNPKDLDKIEKLREAVAKEISGAQKTIIENPKLKAAWQKYQEIIKKAKESGAKVTALNEAQFLKYRSLWANAARLGGMAFLVVLVHGFQESENKADFLAKTGAQLGSFSLGLKIGMRVPGPMILKGAVGILSGIVGSEVSGAAMDWASKGILDRWAPNRGRSKLWDIAGNISEVGMGAGYNNIKALLDELDADVTNINEEDLFLRDKDGKVIKDKMGNPVPNRLYYQEYLSASQMEINFTEGYKRDYFRNASRFDVELHQLTKRLEEEVKTLEKERDVLLKKRDLESEEKLDELEDQLDEKVAMVKTINEQLKISDNPFWTIQQEMYFTSQKSELDQAKEKFPEHFSEALEEQEEVRGLLDNIEARLLSGEGDLIETDREKELWIRLRDQEITIEHEENGETVEETIEFKDWFLRLRRYAKAYSIFTEIRDYGKLGKSAAEKRKIDQERAEQIKKEEVPTEEKEPVVVAEAV